MQTASNYEARIIAALDSAQARTFTDLLHRVPGAPPEIVAQCLDRMGRRPPSGRVRENSVSVNPELHPLLYEWYFTSRAAEVIAEHARGAGTSWLCIGTPSVAAALASSALPVTLLDANDAVLTRFDGLRQNANVLIGEVGDVIHKAPACDVVIVDPPWYPDDVRRWLNLSAGRIVDGGTIISTLFPELTRPQASSERGELIAEAQRLGNVELHLGAIVYDTPRFELEALRALGLADPGDWRVADLLVVREARASNASSLDTEVSAGHRGGEGWERFIIGSQVVFLSPRHAQQDARRALLEIPDCPGDVLTSVSERDPRRARVSLWTSRNRVATATNPAVVRQWLASLSRGADPTEQLAAQEHPDAQLLLRLLDV